MANKKIFFILLIFIVSAGFFLATRSEAIYKHSCGNQGDGVCESSPSCPSGTHQIMDSTPSPFCDSENELCCAPDANSGSEELSCSKDGGGVCLPPSECSSSLSQSYYDCDPAPVEVCCIAQKTDSLPGSGGSQNGNGGGGNSGSGAGSSTSSSGWNINSITGYGLPQSSILGIISGILGWLLAILGLFGIIGFVIAGIIYLISTGDETMLERAKSAMMWSLVGVVVGLLGVVIIQAVSLMLTGSSVF